MTYNRADGKECQACGIHSCFTGDGLCLACRIYGKTGYDVRVAIQHREVNASRWSLTACSQFNDLLLEDEAYYYQNILTKDNSIKACEQLKYLTLNYCPPDTRLAEQRVNMVLTGGEWSTCDRATRRFKTVMNHLLTGCAHCCSLCGAAFQKGEPQVDVIFPVGMSHSGAGKVTFYEQISRIDGAHLLCARCNYAKSSIDIGGLAILYAWRRGRRRVVWYDWDARMTRAAPRYRNALAVQGGDRQRSLNLDVSLAMRCLQLWVTSTCEHLNFQIPRRMPDVQIGIAPSGREIHFGCSLCTEGLIRLGFLTSDYVPWRKAKKLVDE